MARLDQHPTVQRHRQSMELANIPESLDAAELRRLCLELGADDVGFVSIDRPELDDQRADILALYPWTRSLVSIVCRMNREPIRSPAVGRQPGVPPHQRPHRQTARRIAARLSEHGVRAVNPSVGFPMEADRFPGKTWVVAHKPVAVAAGLGQMGIHRNVIHPKFGNFILLATVLIDAEVSEQSRPIDYNPCLECKLCVAACPVGAIAPDGHFDFSACLTHNYREFLGGFVDWAGQVAESKDALDYRRRVSDQETASLWQSLAFGPNYKAAYCMAACPAGDDVIGPFLADGRLRGRGGRPAPGQARAGLCDPRVRRRGPRREEVPAQAAGADRFRQAADDGPGFPESLPHVFQRHQSEGLAATYHFTFTGREPVKATVVIRDKTVRVEEGHVGTADLAVRADSEGWMGFVRKERSLVWALLRRKIVLKGNPRLLVAFGKCFPS